MRHFLIAAILLCAICSAQTQSKPKPETAQGATAKQAATTSAELRGTVTDSSGAVLVDAKITVTSAAGVSVSAISGADGKFVIRGLKPGAYTVAVTAAKFKEFKTDGFNILSGDENNLDALLEPAVEITQVDVTGQTQTQIETEKSEVAGTITERQIDSLPPNGRNFSKFITLTPGVTDQTGQDEAKVGVVGSAKYSVNGGRVEYNTFDIDGTDVLNTGIAASRGHSTFIVYPSLDAISEMKVLTSNYGAQYGRSASGTVLVNTKSGDQRFHGNAYEFVRNEIFNAHGFNDPQGKVPVYRRNDFGFTLGGPIFIPGIFNEKKESTFFFFSEEMRLERSPYSFNQAVPSLNEREGNFSDVCPQPGIFDRAKYPDCPSPVTQLANQGSTRYPTFPGNIIPIDPNAAAVLHTNLVPLANSRAGCNYRLNLTAVTDDPATWPCYNVTASPNTYWREELFRIDHNFSPNLKASFRYIHDSWDTTTLAPQWQYGGKFNSFPTVLNRFIGPGLSLVAHLTAIKSPSLVNDYSVGFTTDHIDLTSMAGPGATLTRPATLDSPCGTTLDSCGIGYLFPDSAGKIPAIFYAGSNAAYGGIGFTADTSFMPWHHSNPVVTIRDDLSKVIRNHTLQVGV
ncbi:MAG TPA: carboxypeptidase regulatory-like domain-containing protein, partial [Aggregatilineales bacterium]|nr:carboxypeptidase regulatory-like domain-containing protein [Aggregatilineales bacterium]